VLVDGEQDAIEVQEDNVAKTMPGYSW